MGQTTGTVVVAADVEDDMAVVDGGVVVVVVVVEDDMAVVDGGVVEY